MAITSRSYDNTEMSSLSAQMRELEKKHGRADRKVQPTTDISFDKGSMTEEQMAPLIVRDDMDSTCLRAPPPSLRSDSDLEQYFRAHVESRCKNAAEIMTPATEPPNKQSAIQREYDLDTWKMYHLIQSSRKPNGNDSSGSGSENAAIRQSSSPSKKERRLSDVSERGTAGVSFQDDHDDDDDSGIFELELDS